MQTWIWIVGALLIGAVLGGVGAFLIARRRWADAARAEELERELDSYKREVGDHFVHTAELVNNLTRSYKAVYDHLEQGAYRLVDEETLRKQLGNVNAESVKLEYIGRRDAAAVLGEGAAASATAAGGKDDAASAAGAPAAEADAAANAADADSSGTVPAGHEAPGSDGPPEGAAAADPPAEESGVWAGSTDKTEPSAAAEQVADGAPEDAPWDREPDSTDEHSLDDDRSPDESGPLKEEGSVR